MTTGYEREDIVRVLATRYGKSTAEADALIAGAQS